MFMLFFKLCFAHFLFDFPLQGDFLSKAKNHRNPIPEVPWQWALIAHSVLQAGAVYYITGSLFFSIVEFILHFCIDWLKCEKIIDFNQDQLLHLFCKFLYALLISITLYRF